MVTGTHGLLSHCQTASWRDPGRRRGGSSMVAETHPPPRCLHAFVGRDLPHACVEE